MKVIKAVGTGEGGWLVSTFASGEWQKEYKPGVTTTPDIGYLFAYSESRLADARGDMCGDDYSIQYWLAEAIVVGRVLHEDIGIGGWQNFWSHFSPTMRRNYNYLLCSSITLVSRIE